MDKDITLKILYRSWKTLMKMVEARKFIVEEKQKKMNFDEFKEKYEDKTINEIFYKKDDNNKEIMRLYIEYFMDPKINAKHFDDFFDNMNKIEGKSSGIIVVLANLTPQANKKLIELNIKKPIQCFNINELMINVTEHADVPKHILIDEKEKKSLLEKYRIKESQLPKILINDPVAKFYGLRKGDVVKIIRNSENAGKYVTYRVTI